MEPLDLSQVKQFVRHHWNIHTDSMTITRNSNKLIIEIMDKQNDNYILKGEGADESEVDRICRFANDLQSILPSTRYLEALNSNYAVRGQKFVFTLETKLFGEEAGQLNDEHYKEIGTRLGKMHNYSLEKKLRLQKATSWSMFGGNETDAIGDYDENELSFRDFKQAFQEEEEFREIETLYANFRKELRTCWEDLPKAATQGDFCPYNMLFENGKMIGLFDFNLAGDEVLLNECVAVGVYLSWHVDYEGNLTPSERFGMFLDHYRKERAWTSLEWTAFPSLFSIIRAFRFDRIDKGIADQTDKKRFIQETKDILSEI